MSLVEGLLIVIILVLTVLLLTTKMGGASAVAASPNMNSWTCQNNQTGATTQVNMTTSSKEQAATMENAEYFTQCPSNKDVDNSCNACDPSGQYTYAVNEFGGAGLAYSDFVTSQAVDPQIIQNHAAFVSDQAANNNQNITGRTYSPSQEVDSYQGIPFQGLRRPEAVSQCDPDQVPDLSYDWFSKKSTISWNGGGAGF
jgi:hypothetical protein